MKTKMNKHDLLIKMYLGNDALRYALTQVNLNNGILEATDGHILIRMPEKYAAGIYKPVEKYPNVLKVMYDKHEGGEYLVKTDALATLLAEAEGKYIINSEKCDDCEGIGVIECRCCGQDADCDTCDGDGTIETSYPFAKLEYSGSNVIIERRTFNPRYLHIIYITALILGKDDIIFKFTDDSLTKGATMCFDDITVLLMPIMPSN